MSRTELHEARRREFSATKLQAELADAKRNADLAEAFTDGASSRFWQVLRAEIDRRKEGFERGSLGMRRDRFDEEQGIVRGMVSVKTFVESRIGKRDHYLKKAQEIQDVLDAAVKAGRIAPRE